jgi:hypothetical protein
VVVVRVGNDRLQLIQVPLGGHVTIDPIGEVDPTGGVWRVKRRHRLGIPIVERRNQGQGQIFWRHGGLCGGGGRSYLRHCGGIGLNVIRQYKPEVDESRRS